MHKDTSHKYRHLVRQGGKNFVNLQVLKKKPKCELGSPTDSHYRLAYHYRLSRRSVQFAAGYAESSHPIVQRQASPREYASGYQGKFENRH